MSTDYAGTAVYPATIPIPEDGDQRDASSVSVPLEGLKDGLAWLKAQVAYDQQTFQVTIDDDKIVAQFLAVGDTWTLAQSNGSPGDLVLEGLEPSAGPEEAQVGDVLEISMTSFATIGSNSLAFLRFMITEDYEDSAVVFTPDFSVHQIIDGQFTMLYEHTVQNAGRVVVQPQGKTDDGTPPAIQLHTSMRLRVKTIRGPS